MSGLRHVVVLNLNYEKNDPRVHAFFKAAEEMLGTIPYVRSYAHYRELSPDTPYDYGFVLDFDSAEDFEKYCTHPQGDKYTEAYWNPGVREFAAYNFTDF